MKKMFSYAVLFFIFAVQIFASEHIRINDYISLEVTDNEYIVEYTSPYCDIIYKTIEGCNGKQTFCQLVYGTDKTTLSLIYDKKLTKVEKNGDIFDYVEGNGVPQLPLFPVELQIPF